jgi:putative Mn2+ efflux pump MntP
MHLHAWVFIIYFGGSNMPIDFMFFFNSILLGVGLAMDAFSVSLANGLHEPCMRPGKMGLVAGVFGIFQGLMPLIGWICIHTVVQYFKAFETLIPWIALILLVFIGGKMLLEGIRGCDEGTCCHKLTVSALLVQGVATSIDALSVGFTIAEYMLINAIVCAVIIALVTAICCYFGVELGKRFGTKFSNKASVFGGAILVLIGIEIFLTGIIG